MIPVNYFVFLLLSKGKENVIDLYENKKYAKELEYHGKVLKIT